MDTSSHSRLPIRRRLSALTVASLIGAVLFLPFLNASSPQSIEALFGFVAATTVVAALAAWLGLRAADAAGLPMPFLRPWELRRTKSWSLRVRPLVATALTGLLVGVVGLAALQLSDAPHLPGNTVARGLSFVFAAVPLEVVVHLCIMSIAVRLARGNRIIGIAAATVALVLFHLSDASTQTTSVIMASIIGNGVAGAALGGLYAVYGFEYAVTGHAVAHLITVLAG